MDGLWQLGDEFRGQSKVSEDHQWSLITSKLAEITRSKDERMNSLNLFRNPVQTKSWDKFGYQDDNKIGNLSLGLMNLDLRMNEAPVKSHLCNTNYNMNMMYQKNINSNINSFKLNNSINKNTNNSNGKEVYSNVACNNNNNNNNNGNNINNSNNNNNIVVDKRFKTLPSTEMLPRNEVLGGYIFVCNNDTMLEDLKRQLFGLPPRYRDSVRAITPGLPLFLYNYTTHQLHGIFEAASFGGSNIDPTAWEDKKCKGESRFPGRSAV